LLGTLLLGAAIAWSLFYKELSSSAERSLWLYLIVGGILAFVGVALLFCSEVSKWSDFINRWDRRK
jgi:hypothetical protein